MKKFVIDDLYEVAEAMYDEIVNNNRNEVMFVGFYDDAIMVIKELMMFEDVFPYSIEIEPEEMDWYDKEYYVTLDDNFELWVQPAYLIKEDGSVYYQSETDVLFIADDCNSAILNRIESEEVIEVTYELDEEDYEDYEDETECNDCCGECCCHNDNNKELSDNSVKTRVAVDNSGRIYGFEKTWTTSKDGMNYVSSYSHYSNDQDLLRHLMNNFDIKMN